jgi:N-acetylglucosaminyl-diphospho-decaprenol L-rhamnosyltransferase
VTSVPSVVNSNIDVIVVGYQGKRWLPECITTLRDAGHPLRLVLVDNGGGNDIDQLPVSALPHIVLQTPRPLGFAEANNFALQHGGPWGEAVCFLNQDTRSQPGWLDACRQCLHDDVHRGAVTPLLRTYDLSGWDPGFWDCAKQSLEFCQTVDDGGAMEPYYEVPVATAAALVVRTAALRKSGPFDPIFGSYYEDYDLCRRIRAAGYTIGICTQATVAHYSGSSTVTQQARRKRMRQIIRNRAIHRIRQADSGRARAVVEEFLLRFPRNLLRGIAHTPSSQPPSVQLAAHWDLLRVAGRLASREEDVRVWEQYLAQIQWSELWVDEKNDLPQRTQSAQR